MKLYEAAQRTFTQWAKSVRDLDELKDSEGCDVSSKVAGMQKKMLKKARKFMGSLSTARDQFIACKAHAPNVKDFLQGMAAEMFICVF